MCCPAWGVLFCASYCSTNKTMTWRDRGTTSYWFEKRDQKSFIKFVFINIHRPLGNQHLNLHALHGNLQLY
jgi:hypothetical protein